jgi:hypothetical protein
LGLDETLHAERKDSLDWRRNRAPRREKTTRTTIRDGMEHNREKRPVIREKMDHCRERRCLIGKDLFHYKERRPTIAEELENYIEKVYDWRRAGQLQKREYLKLE